MFNICNTNDVNIQVLLALPEISASVAIQGRYLDDQNSMRSINFSSCSPHDWTDIHPNEVQPLNSKNFNINLFWILQNYVLCVDLHRRNVSKSHNMFCPKYPKTKNEAWFLTLGSQENDELIAVKRINIRGKRSFNRICYQSPPGKHRIVLTLYLISDCIIGLDQQFELRFQLNDRKSA